MERDNPMQGEPAETSRRGAVRRGRVGRGRGRGSGRRRLSPQLLSAAAAQQQINDRQAERLQEIRAMIDNVDVEELRELVRQLLQNYPPLFFDLWEQQRRGQDQVPLPVPGSPNWCTCSKCREMPTVEERVCCAGTPGHCLSLRAEIATVVLDPLVLGVARAYRNDMLGGGRQIEPNKANRHAAYRQFVLWHYERLGNRNIRAIPSCVVCRIRDTFPDPFGIYAGYIPGRLV